MNKLSNHDEFVSFIEKTFIEPGAHDATTKAHEAPAHQSSHFNDFVAKGLPTRKIERWHYTDLRRFWQTQPIDTQARISRKRPEPRLDITHCPFDAKIHLIDGKFDASKSAIDENLAKSLVVQLTSVSDVQKHENDQSNVWSQDPMAILNRALADEGGELVVHACEKLEGLKILIVHQFSQRHSFSSGRFAIRVAEGARAEVLEILDSDGEGAPINLATNITVEKGASLNRTVSMCGSSHGHIVETNNVTIEEGAKYRSLYIIAGYAMSRVQSHFIVAGENTFLQPLVMQLLGNNQHCDYTAVLEHAKGASESHTVVRAAVDDEAKAIFQGQIVVKSGAMDTDADMLCRGLLLSENARFAAKPELEIYADRVKCGHGATSSGMNEELLFYLRSRGLPLEKARALMIQAFLGEVLVHLEGELLYDSLVKLVSEWTTAHLQA